MQIAFAPLTLPASGTWVVPAAADGALGPTGAELDRRAGGTLLRALKDWGDELKRGDTIELRYPAGLELERVLLLSLGKPEDASRFHLEGVGGSLAAKLRALRVRQADVVAEAPGGFEQTPLELAIDLATGACLRAYRFDKYRTAKPTDEEPNDEVAATDPASHRVGRCRSRLERGGGGDRRGDARPRPRERARERPLARGFRRRLSRARIGARPGGRGPRPRALERLGMRALLGVSQGSVREPRVATLRWSGGAADEPPVALVGKGVCFDSGGLSLKPASGMEEMKWDMGGAAAVFGAMKALAGRKARANVVGVLGLTENMPSGTAQRPGDVVTSMAGLTIEVVNTDAEGRLVLADVLHYAKEHFKPKVIVDLATLTGAIVVALGHEQAGLFTPDDELAGRVQAAGAAVGERVWRMPLGDDYAKHIKSDIAEPTSLAAGGRAPTHR